MAMPPSRPRPTPAARPSRGAPLAAPLRLALALHWPSPTPLASRLLSPASPRRPFLTDLTPPLSTRPLLGSKSLSRLPRLPRPHQRQRYGYRDAAQRTAAYCQHHGSGGVCLVQRSAVGDQYVFHHVHV